MSTLGYPWFVDLPGDWSVQPFKRLGTVRNGQVDPRRSLYCELPLYAPNHIESATGRLLGIESAAEQGADSGKYPVLRGEVVYSKIRPALRKVIIAPRDGLCSADMYAISPASGAYVRFLFWAMLSDGFSAAAELASDRVAMPKVNRETLADFPLPHPPLGTQKAIAAFLDRKTAAIDALIEKKQKLLELLAEKRAALINQAVTKGLDPNVPMKDSGIPWIGEIPAHWEVRRAQFLYKQMRRPPGDEDGVITAFRDGEVTLRSKRRIDGYTFAVKEVGYQGIWVDDLVINSMDAFAGAIGVSDSNGKATGEYVVCTPLNSDADSLYYAGVLRWMAKQGYIFVICPSVRERAPRFRFSKFKDVLLPVPPVDEQRKIIDASVESSSATQRVVEILALYIERLKEYRQALITAAVTGQLEIGEETT